MWSPFLGQPVDSSSFAPWALWHSPASSAAHASTPKIMHAHAAASEKHSTLISLLSMPLIRKRFLETLPSWLHHSESRADATHLDFPEIEDAMKVRGRSWRVESEGSVTFKLLQVRVREDEDCYTITTDASQHASVGKPAGLYSLQ